MKSEELATQWCRDHPDATLEQAFMAGLGHKTVSYTHLDVYKRQKEYDEKMQEASGIISEISGWVKEVKVKYERLNSCLLYTSRCV